MRMSSDFEEVIRKGSINVRPGTTIFGQETTINRTDYNIIYAEDSLNASNSKSEEKNELPLQT